MDRIIATRVAVDQTAGKRSVVGVVLDYFALKDAGEYLVERQLIRLSFFVGVVGNADSIMTNRPDDLFNDVHA